MREKGKKKTVQGHINTSTVIEMICSLLTIPAGLTYVSSELGGNVEEAELRILLTFTFMLLSLSRLLRSRRCRLAGRPKSVCVMQLVYGAVFFICALLPLFMGYTQKIGVADAASLEARAEAGLLFVGDVRQVIALIFWGVVLAGRILSIVRNHKWRNLILNILMIVLILVYWYASFVACDLMTAILVIVVQALISIFGVVFQRVKLDVLRKIIRKTYASEIILGLLLLICAVAYVLKFIEPNIPTFEDGLWYGFAIVTTIGFGDFAAVTMVGRLLSVVLGIYGIVVVALITSIIVNFYGETRKEVDDPEENTTSEDSLDEL